MDFYTNRVSRNTHQTAPIKFEIPKHKAHRKYRWGVLDYVLFVTWRPILWLLNRRRWKVRKMDYTAAIYDQLKMPAQPHPEYIELGSFIPADSFELVKLMADLRIEHLYDIMGSGAVTSMLGYETMKEKLFHTWSNFAHREKQYDTPTRAQELTFGHSLLGYSIDRDGYLAYLHDRARDLWNFLHQPMKARIPVSVFKMHGWVLGMTGAGKSELVKVLVSRLMQQPNATTIVLDPERKLGEEIAHSKDHIQGDSLIYIDPALGRNQKLFPILNPLEYHSEDLDEHATYAEVFVDAMREALKGEITERMETLLTNCARVLLLRSGSTLLDLQRFMDKRRNGDLVELGQHHPDPLVREFFSASFLASDWTKTKDPLAAKLQTILSRPAFANSIMGQSSIQMEQIITSKKTVVLVLDEGQLGTMGAKMWGTFFVAMLESTIRRMRSGSAAQHNPDPVYLIPDEFQRFVTPRFGEILTRARRLGLHLIAANQYIGQEGLSRELAQNMEINTNVHMVGLYRNAKYAKGTAELVNTPTEDLKRLGNGKYVVRAGDQPPIVVQVDSDRLGHSNSMSAVEWQSVAAHQLAEYYRAPMRFDAPTRGAETSQAPPEATTAPTQATPPPEPAQSAPEAAAPERHKSQPKPTRPQRRPKFSEG